MTKTGGKTPPEAATEDSLATVEQSVMVNPGLERGKSFGRKERRQKKAGREQTIRRAREQMKI